MSFHYSHQNKLFKHFLRDLLGAPREGTGTPAWESYNSCAITYKVEQVLRNIETSRVPDTSYGLCQLEIGNLHLFYLDEYVI